MEQIHLSLLTVTEELDARLREHDGEGCIDRVILPGAGIWFLVNTVASKLAYGRIDVKVTLHEEAVL